MEILNSINWVSLITGLISGLTIGSLITYKVTKSSISNKKNYVGGNIINTNNTNSNNKK